MRDLSSTLVLHHPFTILVKEVLMTHPWALAWCRLLPRSLTLAGASLPSQLVWTLRISGLSPTQDLSYMDVSASNLVNRKL